jgi:hypothetical protein
MTMLTIEDIKALSVPFDEKTIGIKVQSVNKMKTKAMLVAYVQHTDAYSRLESVDPTWSCKAVDIRFGADYCVVRMQMTVKGVTRENAGEGGDEKSAYSDALKRCAMLFGVGRYLYDSETVWVDYNEDRDRYRVFTYAEYKKAMHRDQTPLPVGAPQAQPAVTPLVKPLTSNARSRITVGTEIMRIAKALELSTDELAHWVHQDFGGKTQKDLSIEEMEHLLGMLKRELQTRSETA